jgi:molybdate transport system substrate-binding protein
MAAASLQESLKEAADVWSAQGHERPVLSFSGSSGLARLIISGAPADIFISADEYWMDEVEEKGLIVLETRVSFLVNRLVLIAPTDSELELAIGRNFNLTLALEDGRLAMANPDSVPAGKYGRAALQNLGVWNDVTPKVLGTNSVRGL